MPKKRKIEYHEHDTDGLPELSNVASVNECTGLMYKVPVNRQQLEAYRQLSPMGIPREKPARKAEPEEK